MGPKDSLDTLTKGKISWPCQEMTEQLDPIEMLKFYYTSRKLN
jgi:hypothetical protein